jgi:hypothetical protein
MDNNEKAPRGRPFENGNSGRKRGSKNKATLLTTKLAEGQGEAILQKAIELALDGNVPMIKFLLERILPKERVVRFQIPDFSFGYNAADAMTQIVDAVSSGGISPREAADLSQVVSVFGRSIDLFQAQDEIGALRSKIDDMCVVFKEADLVKTVRPEHK